MKNFKVLLASALTAAVAMPFAQIAYAEDEEIEEYSLTTEQLGMIGGGLPAMMQLDATVERLFVLNFEFGSLGFV